MRSPPYPRRASFDTAAEPVLGPRGARTRRPPQDEESSLMTSRRYLMLRSAPFEAPPAAAPQDRLARLEARTIVDAAFTPSGLARRAAPLRLSSRACRSLR